MVSISVSMYSCMYVEKHCRPKENKSRREAVMGERGKVSFEAGDALLALPINTTHMRRKILFKPACSDFQVLITYCYSLNKGIAYCTEVRI